MFDRFRTSAFHFHHSGFSDWIRATFFDRNHKDGFSVARHKDAGEAKWFDISAGRIAVYIEVPPADEHAEEDDFVCVAFDHHNLSQRKRIDLFVSPGSDPAHIHARLLANQSEVLFDGDVKHFSDSFEEPFVLNAP